MSITVGLLVVVVGVGSQVARLPGCMMIKNVPDINLDCK